MTGEVRARDQKPKCCTGGVRDKSLTKGWAAKQLKKEKKDGPRLSGVVLPQPQHKKKKNTKNQREG